MFSDMEQKVLDELGKKPIAIKELVDLVYEIPPMEANNYIAGVVRRINRKCKHNKLDWYLETEGGGRGGLKVWVTERKSNDINKTIAKRTSKTSRR